MTVVAFHSAERRSLALALTMVMILGATTSSPGFGQAKSKDSPVEKTLINLENAWNDASVKRDVAALGRILSDEYSFTDPDSKMWTKAQVVGMLKSGEDVVSSAVSTDMKVHVFGDAAVVTGIYTSKEQLKGKDISGSVRYTDTWVKQSGRWVCVATHASKLEQK